jgi:hypothetical protein
MKVQTINGVPYHVNDKNEVFLYNNNVNKSSSSNATTTHISLPIGIWDPVRNHLQMYDDWQTRIQSEVETYRTTLKDLTDSEMTKARELQMR